VFAWVKIEETDTSSSAIFVYPVISKAQNWDLMHLWFHLRFDGRKYFAEHQNNSSWNSIYHLKNLKFHKACFRSISTFSLAGGKNSTYSMPLSFSLY